MLFTKEWLDIVRFGPTPFRQVFDGAEAPVAEAGRLFVAAGYPLLLGDGEECGDELRGALHRRQSV
jgi:hypothetical protein